MVGVKRTALEPGEMIESITLPLLDGWQGYSKVGVRNAMVIATASACLATDVPVPVGADRPRISGADDHPLPRGRGLGDRRRSTGMRRAVAAESAHAGSVDLAAEASRPIDDHRSTADYRRHAVGVMATRLLQRGVPGGRR